MSNSPIFTISFSLLMHIFLEMCCKHKLNFFLNEFNKKRQKIISKILIKNMFYDAGKT